MWMDIEDVTICRYPYTDYFKTKLILKMPRETYNVVCNIGAQINEMRNKNTRYLKLSQTVNCDNATS
jgi:hypothetical protein